MYIIQNLFDKIKKYFNFKRNNDGTENDLPNLSSKLRGGSDDERGERRKTFQ